nr:hypothetical protein [Tanacetum cinerariifolium]
MIGYFYLLTSLRVIRDSKTVSDTVLKHDLYELVIAEVRTVITNDSTRSSKPRKERFQNFANNSGVVGGERFRFDPFRQAMMSPDGSIVASLENVNGFLAVNTSPDDLICTDFKQEGVVPKVMLHIFKEFILLLGRHPFYNEVPHMEENPSEQSWFGILLVKEVKARLVEFKTQEIKFCEKIRGLERDVEGRNNKIEYLMNELEQDLSWIGLPEFVDDTITDYSRPTPSIDSLKSNKSDLQNSNFSVFEYGESSGSIMSKPMIKFVKAVDCPRVTKTKNTKNSRKSTLKYAEMYKNTSKSPKVKGNQRNWINQKSQQQRNDFVMHNKACNICGSFDHL